MVKIYIKFKLEPIPECENINITIYIKKLYDLKESKYVRLLDLLKNNYMELFKQSIENEEKFMETFWNRNNCLAIMDVINNNDIDQFNIITKYVNILNIEDVISYCNYNGLFKLSKYLAIANNVDTKDLEWKHEQIYGGKFFDELPMTYTIVDLVANGKNIQNLRKIDFKNFNMPKEVINTILNNRKYKLFFDMFDIEKKDFNINYKDQFSDLSITSDFPNIMGKAGYDITDIYIFLFNNNNTWGFNRLHKIIYNENVNVKKLFNNLPYDLEKHEYIFMGKWYNNNKYELRTCMGTREIIYYFITEYLQQGDMYQCIVNHIVDIPNRYVRRHKSTDIRKLTYNLPLILLIISYNFTNDNIIDLFTNYYDFLITILSHKYSPSDTFMNYYVGGPITIIEKIQMIKNTLNKIICKDFDKIINMSHDNFCKYFKNIKINKTNKKTIKNYLDKKINNIIFTDKFHKIKFLCEEKIYSPIINTKTIKKHILNVINVDRFEVFNCILKHKLYNKNLKICMSYIMHFPEETIELIFKYNVYNNNIKDLIRYIRFDKFDNIVSKLPNLLKYYTKNNIQLTTAIDNLYIKRITIINNKIYCILNTFLEPIKKKYIDAWRQGKPTNFTTIEPYNKFIKNNNYKNKYKNISIYNDRLSYLKYLKHCFK